MYQLALGASTELYETVSFSWAEDSELTTKNAKTTKERISRKILFSYHGPPFRSIILMKRRFVGQEHSVDDGVLRRDTLFSWIEFGSLAKGESSCFPPSCF